MGWNLKIQKIRGGQSISVPVSHGAACISIHSEPDAMLPVLKISKGPQIDCLEFKYFNNGIEPQVVLPEKTLSFFAQGFFRYPY